MDKDPTTVNIFQGRGQPQGAPTGFGSFAGFGQPHGARIGFGAFPGFGQPQGAPNGSGPLPGFGHAQGASNGSGQLPGFGQPPVNLFFNGPGSKHVNVNVYPAPYGQTHVHGSGGLGVSNGTRSPPAPWANQFDMDHSYNYLEEPNRMSVQPNQSPNAQLAIAPPPDQTVANGTNENPAKPARKTRAPRKKAGAKSETNTATPGATAFSPDE